METFTKSIERKYVRLGGKEIQLAKLLDFLREIKGSDSSVNPLRYSTEFATVAEACINDGFVETDVRGNWILVDEERRSELEDKGRTEFDT